MNNVGFDYYRVLHEAKQESLRKFLEEQIEHCLNSEYSIEWDYVIAYQNVYEKVFGCTYKIIRYRNE